MLRPPADTAGLVAQVLAVNTGGCRTARGIVEHPVVAGVCDVEVARSIELDAVRAVEAVGRDCWTNSTGVTGGLIGSGACEALDAAHSLAVHASGGGAAG